jgi:hypothetical protein
MTLAALRALVARVPHAELIESADTLQAIDFEVAYLESRDAIDSIAANPYWPKWTGPWWSLMLLNELGVTDRIPKRTVSAMVDALDALPVHDFPSRPEAWPPGVDPDEAPCHCQVGNMDQLLAACGVDVERALPWFSTWYARHQMADGGYNCDDSAYLVQDECPSSMVGTIAPFEAMLLRPPSDACDRAAAFLVERGLRRGSPTRHNAKERQAAEAWSALCFPRFYFYDVLRGASALIHWASVHERKLPLSAVAPVIEQLATQFPDGVVRVGRVGFEGISTRVLEGDTWVRRPALVGSLLERVSRPGAASPMLTRRWASTRRELLELIDRGQVSE